MKLLFIAIVAAIGGYLFAGHNTPVQPTTVVAPVVQAPPMQPAQAPSESIGTKVDKIIKIVTE